MISNPTLTPVEFTSPRHRQTGPQPPAEAPSTGPSASSGGASGQDTYQTALCLVERIDDDLTRGTRHYRTKAGVLLVTLDEVINAILNDDLSGVR